MNSLLQKLFCFLARLCILRHDPFVIGVTGSYGKTTARHIIAEILRENGEGYYTPEGNYNGEWGFALGILQIKSGGRNIFLWMKNFFLALWKIISPKYPHVLVLEYGVAFHGEMDIQLNIVEPDIALFTTLSPSHIEGFSSIEEYYLEKKKILRRKNKKTFAIGNADDFLQKNFDCQLWYGENSSADLVISRVAEFIDHTAMVLTFQGKRHDVISPILGAHHVGIIAGSFLAAQKFGIQKEKIISSLKKINLPNGRGNILRGIHDSIIIDGTYNGGFDPIIAGVEMLSRLAKKSGKKTLALIGDMRELGKIETERHVELWKELEKIPIDNFIFVGSVSQKVIQPLAMKNKKENVFFTNDARNAGEIMQKIITHSPLPYAVFAKGSQNTIYLEEALKKIISDEEKKFLVRQDMMYLSQKQYFFHQLDHS